MGDGFVTVEIVARPGAPRRGLLRAEDRGLVIGIGSPAEKGKANDELVETMARITGVPRSAVSIIRGAGSRSKVVRLASADPLSVAEKLRGLSLKAQECQFRGEKTSKGPLFH